MALSKKRQTDLLSSEKLIEAAQRLFGTHGLEGVSLRQISKAAGHSNTAAVQYHFGSEKGLIRAILERGMPQVEILRATYLAEAKKHGRLSDTRALMEVLYRPLVDYRDRKGERSYARFVLALHSSPSRVEHLRETVHLMPIGGHVRDLVQAANPHIPPSLLVERFRMITIMFLTSIFNRVPPYDKPDADQALIDHALDMATAALQVPVTDCVGKIAQLRRISI